MHSKKRSEHHFSINNCSRSPSQLSYFFFVQGKGKQVMNSEQDTGDDFDSITLDELNSEPATCDKVCLMYFKVLRKT